jgi:hypothetical protein
MPSREARKSRTGRPSFAGAGRGSEAGRNADTWGVSCPPPLYARLRSIPVLVVFSVLGLGFAGCSTAPEVPRLSADWRDAEIAVSNLTAHPWRIALRSPQGEEVKAVDIRPRESLAVVVAGGDYTIEQTLFAPPPLGATTRRFPGRLESGERYQWTLATLLSAEEAATP